ncbi:SusC/RagA family TonB-linked outer membrane protein [Spirosoma sp. HMF4905]|uniref:SusC/RagA family TonB-linked outer membrane protein n=2 Tax=Spirosoma arboris TaxID=2682092 RepID=A0A7K1SNT5_9BACT|nr:SusC/RagA family TonB-linked outer membrane protein [Spirosoma arboris]
MRISLLQLLLTAVLINGAFAANAQELLDQRISVQLDNNTIRQALLALEKTAHVKFVYSRQIVQIDRKVSLSATDEKLANVLERLLKPLQLRFVVTGSQIAIVRGPISESVGDIPSLQTPAVSVDRTIGGTVKSETGEGLPGVSVVVKNTTRGTTTDAEGKFRLTIPEGSAVTLVFSFVGYLNQEVAIGNRTSIDLQLVPNDKSLDEVVVVGYGTVKKSDLTGSLSQVKAKEINSYPATSVLQALTGRAAGVQVLQNTGAPGAPVSVRIRGTNSIQGSNEPLYVVDGFPTSGTNPTVLNNADIETIEVLKDASATAIYGSRGANGVVLITTKHGKAGKTRVDFETSYSSQTLRKKLDLMNAQEYATFYNEQAANDKLKPYFTQDQINAFGQGFDWQNLIFQKAPMKTTALNISGGNEKTQFSLSGSAFNQQGIVKGSDYNRYSLRANINHAVSSKFSVNFGGTLTRLQTGRKDSGGGSRGNSMIAGAISAPPTLTPYNDDGTYRTLAIAYPFVATDLINPLNFINEQNNQTKANVALLNASLIFKPIESITIKVSGGVENRDDRTDNYTTRNFVNSSGSASVSTNQFTSLLSENTISYNKTFNQKHTVSAVAGFTYQDFLNTALSASGVGFLSNTPETYDLGSASTPGIPGSSYTKSVLLSYLARVNYSYNSKYLATVSIRRDGSSKYSEGNKWGYFPSAALAWRVSNEDFMKDNQFISDLKVRASWGLTGSQAINAYATLNQLYSGKTVFGDALYNTYGPNTTLPGNLKWETTEQKDIGVDLGILNNRIMLTADYYIKNTRDLLNTVTLPSSLGYTTTIKNVGEIQNSGLELGIDTRILTGAFKWDVNANISFNRNKVVKLYGGQDILGGNISVVVINDVTNILREGRPLGQFWGYVEDGYDDKGKIKYKDIDGDGSITIKDKTYIGNPNPKYIFGFNSNMSYKNFDLTLFLQGVQGNDIFNASAMGSTIDYGFGLNMPREVYLDHWSPTNPNAKYPIISNSVNARVSNRYVEDGSFVRLKNIQLAYNFPLQNWGVKWVRTAQLYASGQNLLTLTKYSWWDPEVNSKGDVNSTTQGVDSYSYPVAKTITVGLRVGF